MKLPSLLALAILLFSCRTKTPRVDKPPTPQTKNNFYQLAHRHFSALDSLRSINAEAADSSNDQLKKMIDEYKQEIIAIGDTVTDDGLEVVASADKQLYLVSWDSRLGGTMIDNNAIAIYKTADGQPVSKELIDTNYYHEPEGTLMHYDSIWKIRTKKEPLYIALGFGQGSSALQWQELRAFQIDKNYLVSPKIFPVEEDTGRQNSFQIEFDLRYLEQTDVPNIIALDSGHRFKLPLQDDGAVKGYKYKTIVLRASSYRFK